MTSILLLGLMASMVVLIGGSSTQFAYASHEDDECLDSDGDGVTDCDEINGVFDFPPTDPNDPDTDDDGRSDGTELFVDGTDPTNPLSYRPAIETRLMRAIDGYGNLVPNGGWTLSKNITFYFRGINLGQAVDGFKCRIDSLHFSIGPYVDCTKPKSYDNLAGYEPCCGFPGRHEFRVIAVDENGIADPTPSVWRWVILAPSQVVQKLLNMVNNLSDLPNPTETKAELLAPLKGVMWKLDPRNPNNVLDDADPNNHLPVCSKLGTFLDEVNENEASGDITPTQAAKIGKVASDIRAAINCP